MKYRFFTTGMLALSLSPATDNAIAMTTALIDNGTISSRTHDKFGVI